MQKKNIIRNAVNCTLNGSYTGPVDNVNYVSATIQGNYIGSISCVHNVKDVTDYVLSLNEMNYYTRSQFESHIDYVFKNIDFSCEESHIKTLFKGYALYKCSALDIAGKGLYKFLCLVYDIVSMRGEFLYSAMYLAHGQYSGTFLIEKFNCNPKQLKYLLAKYRNIYDLQLFGYILYKLKYIKKNEITIINNYLHPILLSPTSYVVMSAHNVDFLGFIRHLIYVNKTVRKKIMDRIEYIDDINNVVYTSKNI